MCFQFGNMMHSDFIWLKYIFFKSQELKELAKYHLVKEKYDPLSFIIRQEIKEST